MHDPMTVAFEIRYPWRAYRQPRNDFERTYRRAFITIWHVDPERRYRGSGSDDDSCDWFGSYRPLNVREHAIVEALWSLETVIGNEPFYGSEHYNVEYPEDEDGKLLDERIVHGRLGKRFESLQEAIRLWRRRNRRWWQHPRWHIWHWRIQIHPVQQFKRWAFSRCAECGKRFAWGYAPTSPQWHGTGPRWFRGEEWVYHGECRGGPAAKVPPEASDDGG